MPVSCLQARLTSLQQFAAGVQQRSGNHHHRGGPVTRLDVLGFGQFHQLKCHTNVFENNQIRKRA